MSLDEMIVEVKATRTDDGRIRLKYLAIAGGCGPELVLDDALAKQTIDALEAIRRIRKMDGK